MGEIAASYVSIYPKIGKGFGETIRGEVQKAMPAAYGPMQEESNKKGKESGKKFGEQFRGAVTPILAVASVAAIGRFVDGSVSAFAELQDATAAAGVVFGNSMDKITQQAEGAAAAFGISKQQAIDASITFGTFGKSAGLAGDDLADFSTQMTALAGDMASFRGTSPEEAIEAIGSAMRGEAEPIRKYGVLLDDATLRNRALALGLIKTTKDALSPQNKVLAAQAEILAQTKDAQGDFARTADSTANVQKRLAAESANLSAEIGEKLAPAIVEAQKAGITLIKWATDNQAVLVPLIGSLALVGAGVAGVVTAGKALDALKSAKAVVAGLGESFQAMGTKAKVATISMGAIGLALTVGATLYGLYASAQEKATQNTQDFADALKSDNGAIGENTAALIANRLEKEGGLSAAQQLGISTKDVTSAIINQGTELETLRARLREAASEYETYVSGGDAAGSMQTENAKSAQRLLDVLDGTTGALKTGAAAQDRVTAATAAATTATQTNKEALDEQLKSVRDAANAQLALSGSTIGLEAAYDDATSAVKKNGKTLDVTTEKGRANRTALNSIASAGLSVAESLQKTNASGKKVAAAMDDARGKFIRTARQMGLSSTEAKKLADKLGLIKSKNVDVGVRVKWSGDMGKTFTVKGGSGRVYFKASGGKIPGVASHDRDDKVPALLTPDEWVIKRPSARYYGDSIMAALNAGRIPRERLQGYATGGKIGSSPAAPSGSPDDLAASSPDDLAAAVARALHGAEIRIGGMSRLAESVSARILTASV